VPAPHVRRVVALVLGTVVLATTTGCTSGPEPVAATSHAPRERPSPTAKPSSPLRVQVTRVSGRLPARQRRALAARVRPAIAGYVDGALLGGRYPRSDFDGSFGAFSSGAVAEARRDADLLTNKRLGPTTRWVRAARRTAYLSVLAPGGKVAGVTAAVDLVFVVDRGDATPQRVRLAGRLLLTRGKAGHWVIFGYHLHRADAPMRSSS
jgi:hypothetical protein